MSSAFTQHQLECSVNLARGALKYLNGVQAFALEQR